MTVLTTIRRSTWVISFSFTNVTVTPDLGAFAGVIASAKLMTYRMGQLEKKVEKHNTVIERTYKLEEMQAVMQEQIRVANHRIQDLEEGRA